MISVKNVLTSMTMIPVNNFARELVTGQQKAPKILLDEMRLLIQLSHKCLGAIPV